MGGGKGLSLAEWLGVVAITCVIVYLIHGFGNWTEGPMRVVPPGAPLAAPK
jgi:hypothetical protein